MGVTKLRLTRVGARNIPFFRLVAVDSRKARDAKPIEYLGTYDPRQYALDSVKEVRLRVDRIKYWLSVGAQPSDRVAYLLYRAGMVPAPPIRFQPQKSKSKKEDKDGAAGGGGGAAAAPAAASKKGFHTLAFDSGRRRGQEEESRVEALPAVRPARSTAVAGVLPALLGAPAMASFSGIFSRAAGGLHRTRW